MEICYRPALRPGLPSSDLEAAGNQSQTDGLEHVSLAVYAQQSRSKRSCVAETGKEVLVLVRHVWL